VGSGFDRTILMSNPIFLPKMSIRQYSAETLDRAAGESDGRCEIKKVKPIPNI
jgi:hypothetical protein